MFTIDFKSITMAASDSFHDVERKEAFDGFAQEMLLEASKPYNDLDLYRDDMMVYLQVQMDRMLRAKGRGIVFWFCASQLQPSFGERLLGCDEGHWFVLRGDDDDDYDLLALSICTLRKS